MTQLDAWDALIFHLERTGDLLPSFKTIMIMATGRDGGRWEAFIGAPDGATNWIRINRIPSDAMRWLDDRL